MKCLHVKLWLKGSRGSGLLFPGLQSHNLRPVEDVLGLPRGGSASWPEITTFDLERRGRLTESQLRVTAFYRRHWLTVAERTYDRRNRADQDDLVQSLVHREARQLLNESGRERGNDRVHPLRRR